MNLDAICERVVVKATEYSNCGMPRPAWLEKQVAAVHLLEQDYSRGLSLLTDGLQDEQDALAKAKYTRKKP